MTQGKEYHLMKQVFSNYNSFKRFLTLEEIEKEKGNFEDVKLFELNKFKYLARLELSLRALRNELRNNELEELEQAN